MIVYVYICVYDLLGQIGTIVNDQVLIFDDDDDDDDDDDELANNSKHK